MPNQYALRFQPRLASRIEPASDDAVNAAINAELDAMKVIDGTSKQTGPRNAASVTSMTLDQRRAYRDQVWEQAQRDDENAWRRTR